MTHKSRPSGGQSNLLKGSQVTFPFSVSTAYCLYKSTVRYVHILTCSEVAVKMTENLIKFFSHNVGEYIQPASVA